MFLNLNIKTIILATFDTRQSTSIRIDRGKLLDDLPEDLTVSALAYFKIYAPRTSTDV